MLGVNNPGGWIVGAVFWGAGLFTALWALDRYFGVTTLDAVGLRCASLTNQRRIAWADVQGLEVVCQVNRGTPTWFLRVRRTSGRPVRVPGAIRPTNNWSAEAFDQRVEIVRNQWQLATGREDLPAQVSR
jgi:hypothetical protein